MRVNFKCSTNCVANIWFPVAMLRVSIYCCICLPLLDQNFVRTQTPPPMEIRDYVHLDSETKSGQQSPPSPPNMGLCNFVNFGLRNKSRKVGQTQLHPTPAKYGTQEILNSGTIGNVREPSWTQPEGASLFLYQFEWESAVRKRRYFSS